MSKRGPVALVGALVVVLLMPGAAGAGRTVTITGGGWGHGIGMSQYGAYGRALNGRSAEEILEHYYSGAEVTTKKMPIVRVGLLEGREAIAFTSASHLGGSGDVTWRVARDPDPLAQGGPGVDWRVEPAATGGIRLYKNGRQIRRDGTGVFGGPETPLRLVYERHGSVVTVAGKPYKYALGRLEVGSYAGSCEPRFCLRLVLSISMQKYLYGLGEVPSSWPGAALRSQAIAGRTYAYEKHTRSGSHRVGCDCTVYDSVRDQAYIGDAKRTGSGEYWDDWRAAVNDTKRQVISHLGAPIQALYSSSSGGHTEHNENVWGGTPLPYLRGVRDKPDAVDANPNHSWDPVKMRFRAFGNRVEAEYPSIGEFRRIRILERGVSGRVTATKGDNGGMRIVGSDGSVHVSGWNFRTEFGSSILKDTLFYIEVTYDVGEQFIPLYRRLDKAPGDPTGAPYAVPRRAKTPLGKAQNFEKGRMTWRKETDKVVWQWGRVLAKYDRVGREGSGLGMPTTNVWGPGRYRGASYVNGVILWSKKTGAHHVRGPFFDEFDRVGGRERMGLPMTDLVVSDRGLDRQRFKRGTLYRPPGDKEVFALWGAIDEKYRALGGGSSRCGYPTSSMVVDRAGAAATFENGSIVWTRSGGVRVHCS